MTKAYLLVRNCLDKPKIIAVCSIIDIAQEIRTANERRERLGMSDESPYRIYPVTIDYDYGDDINFQIELTRMRADERRMAAYEVEQ